jgi:Ribbon-helix-helix domain
MMTRAIKEDHRMSGPGESKTRACISLRSDQVDALKDVSRQTGAPVAELTRRAVDAYLAGRAAGYIPGSQHRGPVPHGAGSLSPTSRS